jgi:hypothetical protein
MWHTHYGKANPRQRGLHNRSSNYTYCNGSNCLSGKSNGFLTPMPGNASGEGTGSGSRGFSSHV